MCGDDLESARRQGQRSGVNGFADAGHHVVGTGGEFPSITTTGWLSKLTYDGAKSVADNDYKNRFLDPLIEDLDVTLIARNRCRASTT
jgi:hypothetical protein